MNPSVGIYDAVDIAVAPFAERNCLSKYFKVWKSKLIKKFGSLFGNRKFSTLLAIVCQLPKPGITRTQCLTSQRTCLTPISVTSSPFSVDKENQLDVTFCILYFSSNSFSTCFGQPCAHHQELTTAWCYSLVLVCAVAAGRWSSTVGR